MCGGTLDGDEPGSQTVALTPGPLSAGLYTADSGTAGSCMLMAQAALPCALLAGAGRGGGRASVLSLRGGTDAQAAPPADYARCVLTPMLRRRLGVDVELEARSPRGGWCGLEGGREGGWWEPGVEGWGGGGWSGGRGARHCAEPLFNASLPSKTLNWQIVRRGFYPRGGGEVRMAATALPTGQALQALTLARAPGPAGAVVRLTVSAVHAGRLKAGQAQAAVKAAVAALKDAPPAARLGGINVETAVQHLPAAAAVADGGALLCLAETACGCLLGSAAPLTAKGGDDAAARVGAAAGGDLAADLAAGGGADRWLQDQVIVFMALAGGTSTLTCPEPTPHTRAAMEVASAMTGAAFDVVPPPPGGEGGGWTVTCRGAGVAAGTC